MPEDTTSTSEPHSTPISTQGETPVMEQPSAPPAGGTEERSMGDEQSVGSIDLPSKLSRDSQYRRIGYTVNGVTYDIDERTAEVNLKGRPLADALSWLEKEKPRVVRVRTFAKKTRLDEEGAKITVEEGPANTVRA